MEYAAFETVTRRCDLVAAIAYLHEELKYKF